VSSFAWSRKIFSIAICPENIPVFLQEMSENLRNLYVFITCTLNNMVNITISLSEDTMTRLRKAVHEHYDNRKGAISGLVEESLREKLQDIDRPRTTQTFKALRNNRLVAEAEDLNSLAKKLEQLKVDPRSVRVLSSKKLSPVVRLGPRGRRFS
jgi:hypothetical protein